MVAVDWTCVLSTLTAPTAPLGRLFVLGFCSSGWHLPIAQDVYTTHSDSLMDCNDCQQANEWQARAKKKRKAEDCSIVEEKKVK